MGIHKLVAAAVAVSRRASYVRDRRRAAPRRDLHAFHSRASERKSSHLITVDARCMHKMTSAYVPQSLQRSMNLTYRITIQDSHTTCFVHSSLLHVFITT